MFRSSQLRQAQSTSAIGASRAPVTNTGLDTDLDGAALALGVRVVLCT
jgi:hypothetical protein